MNDHTRKYFLQVQSIAESIDKEEIERLVTSLGILRNSGGRLFILGVGGSAANASHAVNDFRKLCRIEAYSPTDNVSELTARINDEGWDSSFSGWLKNSNLKETDAVFVLSVGGGNLEKQVSINLVHAIDLARERKAKIFGIVGRDGGYTKRHGDVVVLVPVVEEQLVTPHSEAYQAVVWHCLVSHPDLQVNATKW